MFTIFISYRRDHGGTFALLLEEKLAQVGFSAFLDHKGMHRGRFDEEISQTIDEASDFVVVLSKDCFSVHEGTDFFVAEIEYALKKKKNIVPIFLNSYSTQQSIPDSIRDVLKYQGVSEHAPQDFESVFLPKLISYLTDTDEKQKYLDKSGARSYLTSRQKLERESLDIRWKNAVEIDICAYFANMLINSDYINQALSNGVHIKYLIVDPDSEAANETMKYRFKNVRKSLFRYSFDATVELLQDMRDRNTEYFDEALLNGELEVKKTSLHLDQAIMIVKKKKESENSVKVDFYTFNTDDTNRRSIMIPFADHENYEFFCKQFEYIRNAAETKEVLSD